MEQKCSELATKRYIEVRHKFVANCLWRLTTVSSTLFAASSSTTNKVNFGGPPKPMAQGMCVSVRNPPQSDKMVGDKNPI